MIVVVIKEKKMDTWCKSTRKVWIAKAQIKVKYCSQWCKRWKEGEHYTLVFKLGSNVFSSSVFSRALIWRGRLGLWPMQSAPLSTRRTASVMYSTSQPWRLCPTFNGLSSNVLAHVVASSGSRSNLPGLRFMSTRLPLERTEPKAVCSCSTRAYQRSDMCVLMDMNRTAHEPYLLVNSCQIIALHKGQRGENKNEYCPVELFEGLFVRF